MTAAESRQRAKEDVSVLQDEADKLNAELEQKRHLLESYRIRVELYEAGHNKLAVHRIVGGSLGGGSGLPVDSTFPPSIF